jgi:large subunit ribosomal protein L18
METAAVRHEKRISKQRGRRRLRVRNRLKARATRPRLAVFRSHKHIYAQIIDDAAGRTLVAASSADREIHPVVGYGGNKAAAVAVGRWLAQRALAAGIPQAAFDRREYKYHGRVAALADAARDAGLDLGAKAPVPEKPPEPEAKPAKGEKKKKEGKPAGKEGKKTAKADGQPAAKPEKQKKSAEGKEPSA